MLATLNLIGLVWEVIIILLRLIVRDQGERVFLRLRDDVLKGPGMLPRELVASCDFYFTVLL